VPELFILCIFQIFSFLFIKFGNRIVFFSIFLSNVYWCILSYHSHFSVPNSLNMFLIDIVLYEGYMLFFLGQTHFHTNQISDYLFFWHEKSVMFLKNLTHFCNSYFLLNAASPDVLFFAFFRSFHFFFVIQFGTRIVFLFSFFFHSFPDLVIFRQKTLFSGNLCCYYVIQIL